MPFDLSCNSIQKKLDRDYGRHLALPIKLCQTLYNSINLNANWLSSRMAMGLSHPCWHYLPETCWSESGPTTRGGSIIQYLLHQVLLLSYNAYITLCQYKGVPKNKSIISYIHPYYLDNFQIYSIIWYDFPFFPFQIHGQFINQTKMD